MSLRRLIALIGVLLCALAALIAGVRAVSRAGRPPTRVAALLPDPGCAAPCWQGLRPGTIEAARLRRWTEHPPGGWQVVHAQDDVTPSAVFDTWVIPLPDEDPVILTTWHVNTPLVDRLLLSQADLTLGDLLGALGEPDYVDFYLGLDDDSGEVLQFRLYYERSVLMVWGALPVEEPVLRPQTPVGVLVYDALPWGRPVLATDWRGFGSLVKHYFPRGLVMP